MGNWKKLKWGKNQNKCKLESGDTYLLHVGLIHVFFLPKKCNSGNNRQVQSYCTFCHGKIVCFSKAMNYDLLGKIFLLPLDHLKADMFLIMYVSSVFQLWKACLLKGVSLMRAEFGVALSGFWGIHPVTWLALGKCVQSRQRRWLRLLGLLWASL